MTRLLSSLPLNPPQGLPSTCRTSRVCNTVLAPARRPCTTAVMRKMKGSAEVGDQIADASPAAAAPAL